MMGYCLICPWNIFLYKTVYKDVENAAMSRAVAATAASVM